MGKRKRPAKEALTQGEIWDDSALIRSWNEAVAEYEFYHSIAAKGEDVEEVLRLAESKEQDEGVTIGVNGTKPASDAGEAVTRRNGGDFDGDLEDGEVDEDGDLNQTSIRGAEGPVGENGGNSISLSAKKSTAAEKDRGKAEIAKTLADGTQTMSEAADATTPGQDQVLENIKMAYWWAGYYSGLHEGQQQTNAASTR